MKRVVENLGNLIALWLAQGLGAGRSPVAPGTIGTLLGVLIYLAIADWPLVTYLTITIILFLIGIPLCGQAAVILGQKDPPSVVFDEVVGYLVTMIAIPSGWSSVLMGFCLFRLFDIWKPWPINLLDRHIQGGLGIMLDDVGAGLLAALCMHLLFFRY